MVVLNMVIEVRIPRVAHEGVGNVGEDGIEKGEAFVQDPAHMDVLVHHQRVGADVADLHDEVQHRVDPGESPEQDDGTGHGRREIQHEVHEHHNVGLHPDDGARDADAWTEEPCVQQRRQLEMLEFDRIEDGRLESRVFRVVQGG